MAGKLSREVLIKLTSDLSGATKIETAVNRVQERVKRLTEAQAKLAGASHNAANGMLKMANNTSSVMKALDRFNPRIARTVSGLSGLISKIGMVNSSLAVAGASFIGRRVVGATRQGMGFNANVETAVNRMAAEIKQDKETIRSAMRRSQTETAWAMKYSREARIFSADTIQHALSDFAVLYRGDMAKARSATQTAALLAAKNPHQGIEGAKIAIQEAESGQWTSPQRRFFLPKSVLEKYKGLGGLGALQATLKEMRIDGGLLQAMGNTAPGMEKQIGAMKGQLAGQATSGLYQSRKDHLAFIRERMEGLTSEKGALTKIAKLTGELGGKLGKMFYGVLEFPVRNADKLLGFLKNLKRGLDPTIAVLKAFGKGIYAGFIQPFNMVVRQLQFTGGVMGKMAGIASKLLGIGGKVATSPLYMLAPLAGMLGRGAGTALAGKTVMKAMRYVGGPRGMFELAKKAGPAGRKLFKEMGIPMFPGDGAMHYGDGEGGNGYVPDAAGKERIMAAAQKSRRKRSAPKASRADGAQDFASILANLIESSNVGNVLGGMAGGNIADVLEKQFLNKLGFFDDLAKAGENLSTVVAGVFEGMQGLLSPVNALGVAVGALIAPFVLLGKIAKTITAPLNSKAGKMVGKIIGTGISPLLMPAMFALGTVGGVNMFKQLGGMVTEGPGSFKKGWTKRIFGSFVNGTDFQQGSRGAQGAGYVNVAGSYVQKGLAALGRMAGNPALGKAGPVLQGLIGRYSGLIGQGMSGMSPVQSGLGALAETGDAILSRMPGAQKKMMQQGIRGINGMVRGERRNINQLMNDRETFAAGGMGISELGKIDKEIEHRSALLSGTEKMLSAIATPTTLKGLNELSSKVQSGLGQKPIQETLQDTIEKMWVKTPDWLSELPIWHTEAPRWLVSLSDIMNRGGGGSGGQGSAAPAGGRPSNIPIGGAPRRRNGRRNGPGMGASGAPIADNNQAGGMPARLDPVPNLPPRPAGPDPDPVPPSGPGGGLIDSLSEKWAKVSGWAEALGVDIKNRASVTAMLDGAKSLSGSLGGLPTAGLGILQGAVGAAGGIGGIAGAGGLTSLYGHLKTGVMTHGAGLLLQAKALRTQGQGHLDDAALGAYDLADKLRMGGQGAEVGKVLKSGLSLAGKTPMAIMGGLGNMSRFMGATLGLMWPMLLGGSAIAGITAISKKIGGAMANYGGGMSGAFGAGRAAFQLAESGLGNIGAKVGKVGGSVVGAGALMLLASKVPGKFKIPAMLLAGLFGGSVGGGLGETGGRMAGAGLPAGLMAMAALPLLRFGGGKLAARYGMNSIGGLAGRGMLGAAKFMDLPGQMFKHFDARFMGGAYDGARTKLLGGASTAADFLKGNTMPFLKNLAKTPGTNPLIQKAARLALGGTGFMANALGMANTARGMALPALTQAAFSRGVGGPAAYRALMTLNAGKAGLAGASSGISSFLGTRVIPEAEANMIKLVGRVGRFLVGTKPGKAVLGTAALLGIGGLAGSVNSTGPGAVQKAGGFFASIKERANTAYQFIGGRQTLDQTAGASILGGLLLGRGGLARIAASRGVAGFLGRAVTGSFGLGQGLYSKLGTAGLRAAASGGGRGLLGFAAKRGLAALGPIGLMASAGIGGYDLGRFAMTQKIGGKTGDQRMLALMTGGIDARDARDKASFDAKYAKIRHVAQLRAAHQISQAQATAMVQQINRDADVGAKKVAEAGKSWFSTAWDWITGKSGPTPAAAGTGGRPPAIPGGGAPGPVPGQSFTGPQLPIGGKNGLDKLIMGMGHAEGWGLTKGKDGSWQMDRSNPATRAPFGLLGDSQKHPELMNNPQLLHDWMVGKLTGTASASVKGQGVGGFSSTVVPGLFNKDGSLNPDKIGELQKKWAPNGAANDPKGLNGNWLGNVMSSLGTPDVKQPNSPASFPGAGTGGSSAISLAFNVSPSGSGSPAEQAKSILSSISTDPAIKSKLTDHIHSVMASPAGQRTIATRK